MTDLTQLYQQVILDHAKERTGSGTLLAPAAGDRPARFGSSHQVNPTCGDEITVEVGPLQVDSAPSDRPVHRWDGAGCSISMASASVASELLGEQGIVGFHRAAPAFRELMHSRGRGEPDEELLGDAAAFQGVSKFPGRIKCALLAWVAFEDAIAQAETMKE
ncbi:Fe-S cluster assembly sulfur transfer protein SufU [Brevibacterium yomogidense]|uniref:Fe-S cluster assembly sulfur transfer protein SufU n=1 Tax=Brevibacterium yomogidense TaxID=946573 RepID=UPI0018DF6C49|nr:SUF system NifU family Fe-S cluster assembly protein [Brevibacterium yomogidense]